MDRLSLTVNEGEILGLIGPNGAGKSTVFNLINGVYPPGHRPVVFDGMTSPASRRTGSPARASRARTRLCSRWSVSPC